MTSKEHVHAHKVTIVTTRTVQSQYDAMEPGVGYILLGIVRVQLELVCVDSGFTIGSEGREKVVVAVGTDFMGQFFVERKDAIGGTSSAYVDGMKQQDKDAKEVWVGHVNYSAETAGEKCAIYERFQYVKKLFTH